MNQKLFPHEQKCNLCGEIIYFPPKGLAILICDKCIKKDQKLTEVKD
jgi:uncharacterized OB-fold protein